VDSIKVFMMPKKAAVNREEAGNANPGNVPVRTDSETLEAQTIARVERTLARLGDFLSKWDSAESRPEGMFPEVVKIRKFHDLLRIWQKEAVSARSKGDEKSRMKRLRDFVILCRMYS
jgi:hypothetical protein